MNNTQIHTTTTDNLYEAALHLGNIFDADPFQNGFGGFDIALEHNGRKIRIAAIDGEWNAGVEIYIFNRSGVVIGQATLHVMGASPHFVAEMAAGMNREIR
jgi:hypothetical protein